MSSFLCDLTNKINELTGVVNRLQQTSGLKTDTDLQDTILGRLNSLEGQTSSTAPSEATVSRMMVEKGVLISSGGTFTLTYSPIQGVVVNDQVLISMSDGTEDLWSGVTFIGNNGTLVGNPTLYDGLTLTATYLYTENTTGFSYVIVDGVQEFVHDFYQHMGVAYRADVQIDPNQPSITVRWENSADPADFNEETITTTNNRILYEPDFNVKLYITGSATVTITLRQAIG
jgi:hypothetical protein